MKYSWITAGVFLSVISILFMGKLLGLPLALIVVVSESMEPALNPFDLILAVKPGLHGGVSPGDIVIYCFPEVLWGSLCFTGQVVGVQVNGNSTYLIARNSASHIMVPGENGGIYVAAARVPSYVFLPLALATLLLGFTYLFIYRPLHAHRYSRLLPGYVSIPLIIALLFFNLAYVGSVSLDASPLSLRTAFISEEKLLYDPPSFRIQVVVKSSGLNLAGEPTCTVKEPFNSAPLDLRVNADSSGFNLTLWLPREVFQELWEKSTLSSTGTLMPSYPARITVYMWLECKYSFREGVMYSRYPVEVTWMEPVIRDLGGYRIGVVNSNPVTLNTTLVVYGGTGILKHVNLSIEPFTEKVVDLSEYKEQGKIYVYIWYVFLGYERSVKVSISG